MSATRVVPLLSLCLIVACPGWAVGRDVSTIGDAPRLPEDVARPLGTSEQSPAPLRGELRGAAEGIDTSDRTAVSVLFENVYKASEGVAANWTGSIDGCDPGTVDQAYHDATLLRVNFFRVMAGLPGDITFDAELSAMCQDAALEMIANQQLSHFPPSTWDCYTTAGAEAARSSNIAIGFHGPAAVDAYVEDSGDGNVVVGHRRWILYPPQEVMGSGSTTVRNGFFNGSNSLWVFNKPRGVFGARPATPEWVAWPPPGFVPYQVVYDRWSLSYDRSRSDFSSATVQMTHEGEGLSLSVVSRDAVGFGDNTIVWEPDIGNAAPESDMVYTVTVRGVEIDEVIQDFTYTVTVFDPVIRTRVDGEQWTLY